MSADRMARHRRRARTRLHPSGVWEHGTVPPHEASTSV
jgi:hypothetical protein